MGELRKVDGAHWDVEMGAITHMLTENEPRHRARASCSTTCPGYPQGYRTLYGQLSSVRRIALDAWACRSNTSARSTSCRNITPACRT